jgi:hypothetical protein
MDLFYIKNSGVIPRSVAGLFRSVSEPQTDLRHADLEMEWDPRSHRALKCGSMLTGVVALSLRCPSPSTGIVKIHVRYFRPWSSSSGASSPHRVLLYIYALR